MDRVHDRNVPTDCVGQRQRKRYHMHPKKRNWIKMEEEDDSFPHEIEEWKKTFAAGLHCG